MLKRLFVLAAGVMLGIGGYALAQVPVVRPGAPGQPSRELKPSEVTPAKAAKHSAADTTFMQGMIGHHAQAIEMVQLLKTRTEDSQMKMLGLRIEVSQNDEIKMMRKWLEDRGETVPGEHAHHMPGGMMPGMLTDEQMAALAEARGTEFDRLFLAGMIQHHGGALVMVKALFDADGAAQEAEIYDFASHVDADQRAEILRMNTMLKGIRK